MANLLVMGILLSYVGLRVAHVSRRSGDPVFSLLLVATALSRIGVGLVNHYLGPLPGAQIDAVNFVEVARDIAALPAGPLQFVVEAARTGYSSLLAVFFKIGGYHFFVPTLVNLVFTIEFVLIVHRIASESGGPAAGRLATAGAAFYPTSIIYTSVSLREAPLIWAFALFVSSLLDYHQGRVRLLRLPLVVGLVTLVWLHDGFALVVFLIPLAMWFRHGNVPVWRRAAVMSVGLALILALFVVALSLIDFRKMPADPAMLLDPQFLSRLREVKSAYGVGYGEVEASWGGILRSWPFLTFAFVSAPFPVWWNGVGELPKVAEGLGHLLLVGAACWTMARAGWRDRRRRLILLMYVYMVLVFAMGTGNTGIAARHRAKFVWMPITLVTLAWCGMTESSRERSMPPIAEGAPVGRGP